jgi:hypothetical protein
LERNARTGGKWLNDDNIVVNNVESFLDNKIELEQEQLERSFLKLIEQWSELMEEVIDILCRGQEKGLRQLQRDLVEVSMVCSFIKQRTGVREFYIRSSFNGELFDDVISIISSINSDHCSIN